MAACRRTRGWIPFVGFAAFLAGAMPSQAAVPLPGDRSLETVDFERHIMGLLGRAGCNMGSCHGSFQGKGGFRLSLFGYEPDKDYLAVTRDNLGRRLNAADPDASLLLLKATGQVEHGGGMRFSKGSWQYQVLRQWIRDGSPWTDGSGAVQTVTITPPELAFKKAGEQITLKVQAKFGDDTTADITPFCDFRSACWFRPRCRRASRIRASPRATSSTARSSPGCGC